MTSLKLGLLPASHYVGPAVLSASELAGDRDFEFMQIGWTEVGKCVTLEPSPQIFHRIAIRAVGRKKCHLHRSLGRIEVAAHLPAVVHPQPIPDDQKLVFDMGFERLQKVDDLLA